MQLIAALVAAVTLQWSPSLDCDTGQPDRSVTYEVAYLYRECDGWWEDWPPPCREFLLRAETRDLSLETIGEADPPVGAGWWVEVGARDGAGNESEGTCQ